MQIERFFAARDCAIEFSLAAQDKNLRCREHGPETIDLVGAFEDPRRLVKPFHGCVEHCQTDIDAGRARILFLRAQQLGLGFGKLQFEDMQALRTVAAQFGREAGQLDSLFVRFEKGRVRIARRSHGKGGQHQMAAGDSLVGAKIRAVPAGGFFKAGQGFLETLAGVALPVVPAVADEIAQLRHIEAIAQLRVIGDPSPEFLKRSLDFSNRYSNGVTGDGNPVPRLTDHRCVPHATTTTLNQNAQCV